MGRNQGPSDGRSLDGVNRALAIVLAGAVTVGATLAALVAAGVVDPTIAPAGWVRDPFSEVASLEGMGRAGAVGASIVVGIISLALLAAEFAPLVRRPYVKAGNGTDREFAVQERAVEQMVCFAGEQLEEVLLIQNPRVGRDDFGLEVACSVVLHPDVAAGPVAPLLEARIRNSVYTMTGLSVGRVRLRIRHAEDEPVPTETA